MKTSVWLSLASSLSAAQNVQIQVVADSGRMPISPWIYGRNNSMSDDPAKPVPDSATTLYNEAGLRMLRESGGNNLTKYNWRRKLSSHPDWYNNVYAHDWDYAAKSIQAKLPAAQGIFGFGLLGWVARTDSANFDCWSYDQCAGKNANANYAGGGDASKYTMPWPADSVTGILASWFGPGGQGLDSTRLRYWSMDNEPEIWNGTHDDVDSALTGHTLAAEEFVQRWAAVAVAARARFPGIKLVGPASPSEWQWYTWTNSGVTYKGTRYSYPEYLIKRLAEIQDSTGVRMLDVYDVHLYFSAGNKTDALQTHRILYDTTYWDPDANGLHTVNGGWDTSIGKQFFFTRIQRWLDEYFGKGNGIGVGSTESGIDSSVGNHASETAVWNASILGTLADHGGELYTPWFWPAGMWESLHLFSRYAHATRVKSVSSLDSLVSAYSSISAGGDSLTVILVNRDATNAHAASVDLAGFVPSGDGATLRLAGLNGETFHSHASNALSSGTVAVAGTSLSISLPKLSVTAVLLRGTGNPNGLKPLLAKRSGPVRIAWSGRALRLENGPGSGSAVLRDPQGAEVRSATWIAGRAEFDLGALARGVYVLSWNGGSAKIPVVPR